jgi:hypothetical protein
VAVDAQGDVFIDDAALGLELEVLAGLPVTVSQATPTLKVSDGGIYNAQPFAASATAVGADGKTHVAGTFSFTYYAGSSASGTQLTAVPVNVGTYTVVASFTSSDPNYTNGTAQTTFTISPDPTSISVSASSAAPVYGQGVTLTATVTTPPGSPIPTSTDGTVTFYDGGTSLGSATLSGSPATATLTNVLLTAGQHTITARYSGDNNFAASQSGVQPTSTEVVVGPFAGLPSSAGDAQGDAFYADPTNSRVVEIKANGALTTVGSGLAYPTGVAVDAQGDVFIDDAALGLELEVLAGLPVTVSPALANAYRISAASTTPTAGASDQLTLTLVDQYGNTETGFSGDKTLTFSGLSTSPNGTVPAVTDKNGTAVNEGTAETLSFTNGVASTRLVACAAETKTLAVTDGTLSSSSTGGTGLSLTVTPANANAYQISAASTTPTAGASDPLTITLVDPFGNVETGFSGDKTLTFSGLSTSPNGTVPAVTDKNGTAVNQGTAETLSFTNGVASASLVAYAAEMKNLKVIDSVGLASSSAGGTGLSLTVTPANANAYQITAASPTPTAGASDPLTITLVDPFGNTETGFSGDKTLTFSGLSTSPNGTLPTVTDKTGTAVNEGTAETLSFTNGVSSAGGVLVATDAQTATLAVTDSNQVSSTSTGGAGVSLTVKPANATHFALSAPAAAEAGSAVTVTVTAQDTLGNTATGYMGTVQFSSSDPNALLPSTYQFAAGDQGVHRFSVIFQKAGSQTVTVTDTVTATIMGSTPAVSVSAGTPVQPG